jgi:thioredoxin reductase (NADPH)
MAGADRAGSRPLLRGLQLDILRRYGAEQDTVVGDVLFADGDEAYDLVVVLAGEVEVVEQSGQAGQAVVSRYEPGEFPGEMGMLTGQRAYLTPVVSSPGGVLRVPAARLHDVMAQEPDLSDLILRAFLQRHSRLTHRGAGLTLVGSRSDPHTRYLLETFARNRLRSSLPPAPGTTSCRWTGCPTSRAPGCITRQPSRRRSAARAGLPRWWVAATRPGRRHCFWRAAG